MIALRVIVGAIFVYSGYAKLREPWALFAMGIDSYHMAPFRFVEPMARILPWFEVVVGVAVIAGLWLRVSSLVVSLLMVVFITAILHAYFTGQEISCGCFGPGEPISKLTIARDGSILAASLGLTWLAMRAPRRTA